MVPATAAPDFEQQVSKEILADMNGQASTCLVSMRIHCGEGQQQFSLLRTRTTGIHMLCSRRVLVEFLEFSQPLVKI